MIVKGIENRLDIIWLSQMVKMEIVYPPPGQGIQEWPLPVWINSEV